MKLRIKVNTRTIKRFIKNSEKIIEELEESIACEKMKIIVYKIGLAENERKLKELK